ncbi:glycosyltransferase [Beduinella massiliensis]|uniref:glycosyltransferase n=1 Tax=Beduinella massiliensis TaxID=1852363 RepID=UPI000C818158
MKKILITFSELFYGGAEKQFRELVERIDKKEFEIVVVVSGAALCGKKSTGVDEFVERNSDIRFYFMKGMSIPKKITKKITVAISYRKQMKEILKKEKPNTVLVYSGVELSAAYLYKKYGAKVIFSERESGNRGKLKFIRYKFLFRGVDKIVCNSLVAKRFYKEHGIEAEYIPNGIEVNEMFDEQTINKHIVVPARIAKVKNQEVVIRAIALLNDCDVKVTFIGNQEDRDYLSYLKQLSVEKGIDRQVEFLPFTSNIKEIYREARIIVLPSKMEGFTNILLESFMFGRVCLVSDIEMNKDVANEGQRFFNPDNENQLSCLIQEVMNLDNEKLKNEIKSNYEYVNKKYTLDVMVNSYRRLFELF